VSAPVRRSALLSTLAVLLLAGPAYAGGDEAIRVNEIAPAAGKVELVDVFRNESFPPDRPEGYAVGVYDGAGNQLASQPFSPPAVFADPVVLDFALPADTGQVCFGYASDPDSTAPPEEYIYHCLGYGNVTNPVIRKRKFQARGPKYLDTLTAAPGNSRTVPFTKPAANAVADIPVMATLPATRAGALSMEETAPNMPLPHTPRAVPYASSRRRNQREHGR
jgi:hypothetical protein